MASSAAIAVAAPLPRARLDRLSSGRRLKVRAGENRLLARGQLAADSGERAPIGERDLGRWERLAAVVAAIRRRETGPAAPASP